MKNINTRKLVYSSMLIALGVVLSNFYIPFGVAKCFPVQHLINVIGAVTLGPVYALINAFVISVIRNLLGMGSLLAFPGSMVGAFLAGIAANKWGGHRIPALFEVIGTGIIGGIIATPIAILLMGKEVGIFFFVMPFLISTAMGSVIAVILFETTALLKLVGITRRNMEE